MYLTFARVKDHALFQVLVTGYSLYLSAIPCTFYLNMLLPTEFFLHFSVYKLSTFSSSLSKSRHTVVCRAAQENGARANRSEYINRNSKVAIFTHP